MAFREKDKMDLARTNPRGRNFGSLCSGEYEYNSYLAGMKPRTKGDIEKLNNFRLHDSCTEDNSSLEKTKAKKALYTEMSSVPVKKSAELSSIDYQRNSMEKIYPDKINQEELIVNESTMSVGKLRSLFDSSNKLSSDASHQNDAHSQKDQLRKQKFPLKPIHIKRADIKVQKVVQDKPTINVNSIMNNGDIDAKHSDSLNSKNSLNIDAIVSIDKNSDRDSNNKNVDNSVSESVSNCQTHETTAVPLSKTKGMHGLLQRRGSEFDYFEDRIVPTGIKKIDINSLVAPTQEKSQDGNNNSDENSTEYQNESYRPSKADIDLQNAIELNRLMSAQSAASSHRRRSLKDRLSDIVSTTKNSFDEGDGEIYNELANSSTIVSPSSIVDSTAKVEEERAAITLPSDNHKTANQLQDTLTESLEENNHQEGILKSVESIPKYHGKIDIEPGDVYSIRAPINSDKMVNAEPVETNNTISGANTDLVKDNIIIMAGKPNFDITNIKENLVSGCVQEIALEDKLHGNNSGSYPDIIDQDSNENVPDSTASLPYKSTVERFDAFLTDHAISNPDLLSPLPTENSKADANGLPDIHDGEYEEQESESMPSVDLVSSKDFVGSHSSMNLMGEILDQIKTNKTLTYDVASCEVSQPIDLDLNLEKTDKEMVPCPVLLPRLSRQSKLDIQSPTNEPVTQLKVEQKDVDFIQNDRKLTIKQEDLINELSKSETVVQCENLMKDDANDDTSDPFQNSNLSMNGTEKGAVNQSDVVMITDQNNNIVKNNNSTLAADRSCNHEEAHNEVILESKLEVVNEELIDMESISLDESPVVPKELELQPKKSNLLRKRKDGHKKVVFNEAFLSDVIYTYGPTEYDRANADIDPIASSAEWELEKRVEKMDIFSVDLQKDERGLGLSIIGLGVGTETGVEKLGIFVKTLTENGASQKDGRIQVNDQILEVNGISLVGVTQYFAAQTLKNTENIVRFLMGREKSRKTQYAPGAPLAANPEMHKHIEEMNKVLHQMEELEDRAVTAENTLEEVKVELLKAEERAHDAERQLQEAKDQLTAATESPFVGAGRKLKNEIKKKGGKQEKMDLQQSLKNITNRLSASEENLLETRDELVNKDMQLSALEQKIEDRDLQLQQMEHANNFLHNEMGSRIDEINSLKTENSQLKLKLNELYDIHCNEIDILKNKEREIKVKVEAEEQETQRKCLSLLKENKMLKDEIVALQSKIEINEHLLSDVEKLKEVDKIKFLELKLEDYENKLKNSKDCYQIMQDENYTLKGKNNYLESLVTKISQRDELVPDVDIRVESKENKGKFDDKCELLGDNVSMVESQVEVSRSSDLVSLPDAVSITVNGRVSPSDHTPELPLRGYINVTEHQNAEISSDNPPQVSRDRKPGLKRESYIESDVDIDNNSDYKNNNNDAFISTNSESAISGPIEVNDTLTLVENLKNPLIAVSAESHIPQLLTDDMINIGYEKDISGKEKSNLVTSNLSEVESISSTYINPVELNLSSANEVTSVFTSLNIGTSISENVKEVPSNELLIIGNIEDLTISQQETIDSDIAVDPESDIDLKQLSEGKIDNGNESEGDQGQFEIIHEDVEEETQTPTSKGTMSRNTDRSNDRIHGSIGVSKSLTLPSHENYDQWVDRDWISRLDSTTREVEAELMASQVTARTPNAGRKSSISSSSDSEDEPKSHNLNKENLPQERSQSIKIDPSYFMQSAQKESVEMDFNSSLDLDAPSSDQSTFFPVENDKDDVTDTTDDTKKSLSLDAAVPATVVLDNKVAHDKRGVVMKQQRQKPSRGFSHESPRMAVSVSNIVTIHDAERSESSASTLSREKPRKPKSSNLQAALSVPNLSLVSDGDKPYKHKHKFLWRLPRAFKKTKLGKRISHGSVKNREDKSQSLSDSDLTSNPSDDVSFGVDDASPPKSPSLNLDAGVVPIEEKAEELQIEKANDAATEEAVVPFADKEMLMRAVSDSDVSINVNMDEKPSPSVSSVSAESPSHESVTKIEIAELDDVNISISPKQLRSTEIEFSSFTVPKDMDYNERGVDVEIDNGHTLSAEIVNVPVTAWNTRQVGIWLVSINMEEYVNGFKLNQVDGPTLLQADGKELKDYGVMDQLNRAELKRHIKEFRIKYGKGGGHHQKTPKDKLQFWKGKYKIN